MSAEVLRGLVQPDQRTCGPSCLVAAQLLIDPAYAVRARPAFAAEVLALHRRLTGPVGLGGAAQLPWPRALGTPAWAAAAALSTYDGPGLVAVRYATSVVAWRDRADLLEKIRASTSAGRPVAIYVGDRWLPRHVVLAVAPEEGAHLVYNPARGALEPMSDADFSASTLRTFGRWTRPWFVVLPAAPR